MLLLRKPRDRTNSSASSVLSDTAINLKTWITAAFRDSMVNNLIKIDGTIESAFLFVGVGHGTNQSIPEAMLQIKSSD